MDTGTDGRFYDSHYDFNGDGKLSVSEYMVYDDAVTGKNSGGYSSYRRTYSGGSVLGSIIKTLIVWGFLAVGICLMALFPLLGIPFVLIGYAIKEG